MNERLTKKSVVNRFTLLGGIHIFMNNKILYLVGFCMSATDFCLYENDYEKCQSVFDRYKEESDNKFQAFIVSS